MVTIAEVAKEADVSPATVSRVINNSLVVSESKRQRVLEAIRKLGYVIPMTSPISNGKILLAVSDIPNTEFNDSLYRAAADKGYQLIFFHYCEGPTIQNDLYDFLQQMAPIQQIAGIILCNFIRTINSNLKNCLNNYPVVQIGCACPLDRTITFDINHCHAAYDATSMLIERGCRRIAIFGSGGEDNRLIDKSNQKEALNGYRSALFEHGLIPDDKLMIECDFTAEGARDATLAYLKSGAPLPDGIICPIDTLGMGCLWALQQESIRVPDEIKLICLFNDWFSDFSTPRLSTLVHPFEKISVEAVRTLHNLISGDAIDNQDIKIPYRFELRESTGD